MTENRNVFLSIIIPVYNAAQYIRQCVESIISQNINEDVYEVILVNDETQDNSIDVIDDIIECHSNFIVLEQKNGGPSLARNLGLSYARGHFIQFVDADDFLIQGAVSRMLDLALKNDVDILIADYIDMENKEMSIPDSSYDGNDFYVTSGQDFFIHGFDNKTFVWRAIYKADFLRYNNVCFFPGICFEDILFTIDCIMKSSTCLKISSPLYVYRHHQLSYVHSIDVKKINDLSTVIAILYKAKHNINNSTIRNKYKDFIFVIFKEFIWYIIKNKELYFHRKLIVKDLRTKVRYLCFSSNLKQFLLTVVFSLFPCTYIKIRRYLDLIVLKINN